MSLSPRRGGGQSPRPERDGSTTNGDVPTSVVAGHQPSAFEQTYIKDDSVANRPDVSEWMLHNIAYKSARNLGEFSDDAVFFKTEPVEALVNLKVRTMTRIGSDVWIAERNGSLSVWDLRSASMKARTGRRKEIFACSIVEVGMHVWVGFSDGLIRVFEPTTMDILKETKQHAGAVLCMENYLGSCVFSGSGDFVINQWDAAKCTKLRAFTGHKNGVRALVLSGNRLFSASDDKTIIEWDTISGKPRVCLTGHSAGVTCMVLSAGALWSGGDDGSVRVWSINDHSCQHIIREPHGGPIQSLSAVGGKVWSSSLANIFAWDAGTFDLEGQYREHEGYLTSVVPVHMAVVSRVWSAGADGRVNLWNSESPWDQTLAAHQDGKIEQLEKDMRESAGRESTLMRERREQEDTLKKQGQALETTVREKDELETACHALEEELAELRTQNAELLTKVKDNQVFDDLPSDAHKNLVQRFAQCLAGTNSVSAVAKLPQVVKDTYALTKATPELVHANDLVEELLNLQFLQKEIMTSPQSSIGLSAKKGGIDSDAAADDTTSSPQPLKIAATSDKFLTPMEKQQFLRAGGKTSVVPVLASTRGNHAGPTGQGITVQQVSSTPSASPKQQQNSLARQNSNVLSVLGYNDLEISDPMAPLADALARRSDTGRLSNFVEQSGLVVIRSARPDPKKKAITGTGSSQTEASSGDQDEGEDLEERQILMNELSPQQQTKIMSFPGGIFKGHFTAKEISREQVLAAHGEDGANELEAVLGAVEEKRIQPLWMRLLEDLRTVPVLHEKYEAMPSVIQDAFGAVNAQPSSTDPSPTKEGGAQASADSSLLQLERALAESQSSPRSRSVTSGGSQGPGWAPKFDNQMRQILQRLYTAESALQALLDNAEGVNQPEAVDAEAATTAEQADRTLNNWAESTHTKVGLNPDAVAGTLAGRALRSVALHAQDARADHDGLLAAIAKYGAMVNKVETTYAGSLPQTIPNLDLLSTKAMAGFGELLLVLDRLHQAMSAKTLLEQADTKEDGDAAVASWVALMGDLEWTEGPQAIPDALKDSPQAKVIRQLVRLPQMEGEAMELASEKEQLVNAIAAFTNGETVEQPPTTTSPNAAAASASTAESSAMSDKERAHAGSSSAVSALRQVQQEQQREKEARDEHARRQREADEWTVLGQHLKSWSESPSVAGTEVQQSSASAHAASPAEVQQKREKLRDDPAVRAAFEKLTLVFEDPDQQVASPTEALANHMKSWAKEHQRTGETDQDSAGASTSSGADAETREVLRNDPQAKEAFAKLSLVFTAHEDELTVLGSQMKQWAATTSSSNARAEEETGSEPKDQVDATPSRKESADRLRNDPAARDAFEKLSLVFHEGESELMGAATTSSSSSSNAQAEATAGPQTEMKKEPSSEERKKAEEELRNDPQAKEAFAKLSLVFTAHGEDELTVLGSQMKQWAATTSSSSNAPAGEETGSKPKDQVDATPSKKESADRLRNDPAARDAFEKLSLVFHEGESELMVLGGQMKQWAHVTSTPRGTKASEEQLGAGASTSTEDEDKEQLRNDPQAKEAFAKLSLVFQGLDSPLGVLTTDLKKWATTTTTSASSTVRTETEGEGGQQDGRDAHVDDEARQEEVKRLRQDPEARAAFEKLSQIFDESDGQSAAIAFGAHLKTWAVVGDASAKPEGDRVESTTREAATTDETTAANTGVDKELAETLRSDSDLRQAAEKLACTLDYVKKEEGTETDAARAESIAAAVVVLDQLSRHTEVDGSHGSVEEACDAIHNVELRDSLYRVLQTIEDLELANDDPDGGTNEDGEEGGAEGEPEQEHFRRSANARSTTHEETSAGDEFSTAGGDVQEKDDHQAVPGEGPQEATNAEDDHGNWSQVMTFVKKWDQTASPKKTSSDAAGGNEDRPEEESKGKNEGSGTHQAATEDEAPAELLQDEAACEAVCHLARIIEEAKRSNEGEGTKGKTGTTEGRDSGAGRVGGRDTESVQGRQDSSWSSVVSIVKQWDTTQKQQSGATAPTSGETTRDNAVEAKERSEAEVEVPADLLQDKEACDAVLKLAKAIEESGATSSGISGNADAGSTTWSETLKFVKQWDVNSHNGQETQPLGTDNAGASSAASGPDSTSSSSGLGRGSTQAVVPKALQDDVTAQRALRHIVRLLDKEQQGTEGDAGEGLPQTGTGAASSTSGQETVQTKAQEELSRVAKSLRAVLEDSHQSTQATTNVTSDGSQQAQQDPQRQGSNLDEIVETIESPEVRELVQGIAQTVREHQEKQHPDQEKKDDSSTTSKGTQDLCKCLDAIREQVEERIADGAPREVLIHSIETPNSVEDKRAMEALVDTLQKLNRILNDQAIAQDNIKKELEVSEAKQKDAVLQQGPLNSQVRSLTKEVESLKADNEIVAGETIQSQSETQRLRELLDGQLLNPDGTIASSDKLILQLIADRDALQKEKAELRSWLSKNPHVPRLESDNTTLDALEDMKHQAQDELQGERKRFESQRHEELGKFQRLVSQLHEDLATAKSQTARNDPHSLARRLERIETQLHDQKLTFEAGDGEDGEDPLSATQRYITEREEKWKELSRLNKELHSVNAALMGESSALATRLGELGYYFETRPTLVRSILEMHRLLVAVPKILKEHLGQYEKKAPTRQLLKQHSTDVQLETDSAKEGSRWILANLFTAFELQHCNASPAMFVPDRRRPTWRDISLPSRLHAVSYTAAEPAATAATSASHSSPSMPRVQVETAQSQHQLNMHHQVLDFPRLSASQQRRSASPAERPPARAATPRTGTTTPRTAGGGGTTPRTAKPPSLAEIFKGKKK